MSQRQSEGEHENRRNSKFERTEQNYRLGLPAGQRNELTRFVSALAALLGKDVKPSDSGSLRKIKLPEIEFWVQELKAEFQQSSGRGVARYNFNFRMALLLRPEQLETISDEESGATGEQATIAAQGDGLGEFVLISFPLAAQRY